VVERRRAAIPAMRSTLQVGIAILLWSAALVFGARGTPQDCESPIWSTEVLPELALGRRDVPGFPDTRRAGVVFSNDGRLLVFQVDERVVETHPGTIAERLKPFLLRLLLLDPASGMVILRKEERTSARQAARFAKTGGLLVISSPPEAAVFATTGGLLVKSGPPMELYSPDLAQQRDLPFQLARNSGIVVSVSPTGQTIMFNDVIEDPSREFHSHFTVLDARTLKVRYSWDQSLPLYHSYSISDRGIAAVFFDSDLIAVSEFGRNWWTPVGKPFGICFSSNMPTLYSDQELTYGCDRLVATSTDGQVLMTDVFPRRETSSGKTAVAQGGRFIAVSLHTEKSKFELLALESYLRIAAIHIRVYDMALRKQILTVGVTPLPRKYYDFALSPDGSKLAVLDDRRVSLYAVPVQSADRPQTVQRETH